MASASQPISIAAACCGLTYATPLQHQRPDCLEAISSYAAFALESSCGIASSHLLSPSLASSPPAKVIGCESTNALELKTTTNTPVTQATPPLPTATKFQLFPCLPTELRLLIWYHTLPGPRLIELTRNIRRGPSHDNVTSTALLPIALAINHESRTLAQQHYKLSFASSTSQSPKVYFSPERDILFYHARWDCPCCPSGGIDNTHIFELEDFAKVRRLALHSEDLCVDPVVYKILKERMEGGLEVEYWPVYPQMAKRVLKEWRRRGTERWVELEREDWRWQLRELKKRFGRKVELGMFLTG